MLEPLRGILDLDRSVACSDQSQDGVGRVSGARLVGDGVHERPAGAQMVGDPACAGSGCGHGLGLKRDRRVHLRFGRRGRCDWQRGRTEAQQRCDKTGSAHPTDEDWHVGPLPDTGSRRSAEIPLPYRFPVPAFLDG